MKVTTTPLPGVLLVAPDHFGDARGYFFESWNRARYAAAGLPSDFVQDNFSLSRRGVLRGLHFQNPGSQGKLVSVLQGEVFDVAVDLRRSSATFGQWYGVVLSAENHLQLYIPEGFAHGFQVTSEAALFHYKCTAPYHPAGERTIRWDDPELGVVWPLPEPVVSAKDAAGKRMQEAPADWWFA